MNPAWSVVFLTTLIGAGQGLFLVLYATEVAATRGWVLFPGSPFMTTGALVSLVLTGLGLLASFFHLGRPERAWRTATKWRTSWLSREVIVLPAFLAASFAWGAAHWLGLGHTLALGALATVLCVALFVCTGMVYACIRFLQEWASPLTLLNYFLLGAASGCMTAVALAAVAHPWLVIEYANAAALLTLAALVGRGAALLRNERLRPASTLQSATGIDDPRVVQKAMGFMGGSFNTREFFHGRTPAAMQAVKWAFLVLAFPVPVAMLVAGLRWNLPLLLLGACCVQYLGLLAERWFFLAQANHPQNLYYQMIS
jgi:DMSO reductase anchor subunit